jgi:uncharacterized protein YjbJ (UPF0337 family)
MPALRPDWPNFNKQERTVDRNRLAGRWKQMRGTLRMVWGRLIRDAALAYSGERERVVGRLQEAYGLAKDRAARRASAWQWRAP